MFITHGLAQNLVPYGHWNSYRMRPFLFVFFVRCVSEGVKSWLWLAYFCVSMATLFGNMQFIYKTCILHSTDSVICFYLSTWNKLNKKKKNILSKRTCMDGRADVWLDGQMDERTDRWIYMYSTNTMHSVISRYINSIYTLYTHKAHMYGWTDGQMDTIVYILYILYIYHIHTQHKYTV